MFEKEAEEKTKQYMNERTKKYNCENTKLETDNYNAGLEQGYEESFKEGAEFGYNQARKEMSDIGLALQSDMDRTIEQNLELKKENEELKDYRLITLKKQQTEIQKYAVNLEHKLSWYDTQLTEAKEIIKHLLYFCNKGSVVGVPEENCSISADKLREQAKQFLDRYDSK